MKETYRKALLPASVVKEDYRTFYTISTFFSNCRKLYQKITISISAGCTG